jgi:aspartyl-tRNA(Asn)/glutamyl-tRNA(Gln) amidotransferase subunit B
MIIEGEKGKYEIVIGIEIHAQVNSKAKLFSKTKADSGNDANEDVSFFDIASPGKMPILNEFVLNQAIKTGLSLNAEINEKSIFDRKHYFYPDLPQGYQITQFYEPIIKNGFLMIELEDGSEKKIRINRAHLEQDAGKLIHDLIPNKSAIDLNRSGVPLLEIVSEPDIKSSFEACEYIKNLRAILRAVGTCNANMEKGEMRCDINISVMPLGSKTFGTRCEIKNVNSVKFAGIAIEFEAERQVREIEAGREIICETRTFDANTGETKSMRVKESSEDYRYIPEPDLKPVLIAKELIEKISKEIPELPFEKIKRYKSVLGLSKDDAILLNSEKEFSQFFEAVISKNVDPKLSANWITTELFARLKKAEIEITNSPINPESLAQLIKLIQDATISGKQAKEVLTEMFETGKQASEIIEEKGLVQVSDVGEITKIIDSILLQHSEKVLEFKSGKTKLLGFFTGEVLKLSKGKANPAITSKILLEKLNG